MKNDYDPGELKECVYIQRSANTKDAAANVVLEPYTTFLTTRASIVTKASSIQSSDSELIHSISTEIVIRNRPDLTLLATDRIVDYIHKKTYEQTAPAIVTINKKWLVYTCREVVDPNG